MSGQPTSRLPDAATSELGEILARIDRRMKELNMSLRGTARAAGLSPAQLRTMRRQYLQGRQRSTSLRTIVGLAEALRTTPEWLISGTGSEPTSPPSGAGQNAMPGLRLAGAVEAGSWKEIGSNRDRAPVVAVPPDPRYPPGVQAAYEVRGNSANRIAQPGDFLIVVDRDNMGLPLRSGDLVIVTASKSGLQEVTARRYRLHQGRHCFAFESDDPRYSVAVELPKIEGPPTFQIRHIVVAVYRPLS